MRWALVSTLHPQRAEGHPDLLPDGALLGALLGLGMLAQRSELVVMQASGFTRPQVALAVMKTAIPLVLLTMAIGEWVPPQGASTDGAQPCPADALGGSLL